ncbi:MAG: DUF1456 family protein [Myxococcota bacterium]|nr:DUF1456 family protein [Myxococcota bacterium]
MDNNQILKKLSIALSLRREDVREIFHIGGKEFSNSQTGNLLVSAGHKNFSAVSDEDLSRFLDGLITYSRGPKDHPQMVPLAIVNTVYDLGERGNVEALQSMMELVDDVLGQVEEQISDGAEEGEAIPEIADGAE